MTTETSELIQHQLETCMKMLTLTSKGVVKLLEKNKLRDIQKTLKILEDQKDQVENLKIRAQTLMFSENKSEDDVSKFGDEIDQRLTVFDDKFDDLQAAIDKVKSVEVMIAKGNFEVEEQRRM